MISYAEIVNNEDPSIRIFVCDLDLGDTFEDPLIMFEHVEDRPYNEEGIYAVGGEIHADLLEKSYSYGIFPWFPFRFKPVFWYCPRKRYVIFPERIHISHSMRTMFNQQTYRVTINEDFESVIRGCSQVDNRIDYENAWLGEEMMDAFIELHKRGKAISVEVWKEESLAGGFYGYFRHGVLQGESMFSLEPSASKYGLIALCRLGEINGEKLKMIDTQFETPLFKSLAGEYISYREYRQIMDN